MDISEERLGDVLVVAPAGRIDSTTSGALERKLIERLAAGEKRLLIDLLGVEYISSAGLRVLLVAANRLKAGDGRLALCSLSQSVLEVFELAGFNSLCTIDPSREQALVRFAG
jgi:anti-anti-sigma factor